MGFVHKVARLILRGLELTHPRGDGSRGATPPPRSHLRWSVDALGALERLFSLLGFPQEEVVELQGGEH